jgi:Short C-terminal domain/SPOR domain
MSNGFRAGRTILALTALAAVAACSMVSDPKASQREVAALIPSDYTADRAMTALSRGDTGTAETYALGALRRNPKDPYALLVAGLAHQATNRYDQARQYYDVIISNQLPGSVMLPSDNGTLQPRPVVEVARANRDLVDKITGRGRPGSIFDAGRGAGGPVSTDAETNVAGRFRILKRLLDDGLLTPEEYTRRRTTNLGALLPFSAPPPAQGLERPVPPDGQITDRLRALATAVENREMQPREQGEERTMILDALMPGQPRAIALPPLPPKDLLEQGQAVGRLERMRTAGLITSEEAARDRQALERAFETQQAGMPVEGSSTGLRYGGLPNKNNGKGGVSASSLGAKAATGWGVSLMLAKTEAAATTGLEQVKAKFPEELGNVPLSVKRAEIRGKGTRWRVVGGPLDGKQGATRLCKTLKLHRQACDAISLTD